MAARGLGILLVLLAAGCGSAVPARHDPAPVALATKCGTTDGAHAPPLWLHTSDGVRLYAAHGGAGKTGVVLMPESPPGDVCGWLPTIGALERAGLRVLALDYRGTGNSPAPSAFAKQYAYGRDLAAAIAQLRADGAKKVIVMGASFGGAAVLAYGPGLDADGIVSLSGETSLPARHVDALAAVPRLRAPLLIVGTRRDGYLPVADALRLLRRAGSADKRTMFFPGGYHGWDIVQTAPYAGRAWSLVLRWLRSHG